MFLILRNCRIQELPKKFLLIYQNCNKEKKNILHLARFPSAAKATAHQVDTSKTKYKILILILLKNLGYRMSKCFLRFTFTHTGAEGD